MDRDAARAARWLLVPGTGLFMAFALWRTLADGLPPAEIPTFDVADYVTRGWAWAAALETGDARRLAELASEPNRHPAGHPAALGVAFWMAGTAAWVEGAATLAVHALQLALTVLLARSSGAVRGVGVLSFAFANLALLSESMRVAPMTEPLAGAAAALAIWAGGRAVVADERRTWFLCGGLAVAAGCVRYNLLPTVLLAIAAAAGLRSGTLGVRAARLGFLTAPSALVLGLIVVANPEFTRGLEVFFGSGDNGIPALSVANLAWFGGAWVRQVFGRVDVALVAAALAVASVAVRLRVRAANHPAELPVALFVLVGFGSLLAHPFKLDRNLYVFVGPTWLLVLAPFARVATTPLRAWALAAGGLVGLYGYHRSTEGLQTEQYYYEDRHVRHALEAATAAATEAERVVLVGAHRDLSAAVFTYWLRRHGFSGEVIEQEEYPPSCGTPAGAEGPLCHPLQVGRYADERGVVFVTVDALDVGGGRRAWRTAAWQETADWLEARRYRYDELSLREQGLRVRVYR